VEYDRCPLLCPKDKNAVPGTQFCSKCPRKQRRLEFQRSTERLWEERLGENYAAINFAEMETQVHYTLNACELPESERSVTLGTLISAYEAEKAAFRELQRITDQASG
jgi:hypothetical protein